MKRWGTPYELRMRQGVGGGNRRLETVFDAEEITEHVRVLMSGRRWSKQSE
jgi:hypothetical protein